MKRDYKVYLEDILESTKLIKSYTRDLDERKFNELPEVQDAIIRRLEIIGEAAKNIPTNIRNKFPKIPWKEITGMRDVLAHEYFGIGMSRVWKTVKTDVPKLEKEVKKILKL